MSYEELVDKKISLESKIKAAEKRIEEYNNEALIYDSEWKKNEFKKMIEREEDHIKEYTIELDKVREQLIPYKEQRKKEDAKDFEEELESITDFRKLNEMAEQYRLEADRIEDRLDSGKLKPDKYIELEERMNELRRRAKLCSARVFELDSLKTEKVSLKGNGPKAESELSDEEEIVEEEPEEIIKEDLEEIVVEEEQLELSYEELVDKKISLEARIREAEKRIERYNNEALIYDSEVMKNEFKKRIAREEDHIKEYTIELDKVREQLIPYKEQRKKEDAKDFEEELESITDFRKLNEMAEQYRLEADRIEDRLDSGKLKPDKYIELEERMNELRRRAKLCSARVFELDSQKAEKVSLKDTDYLEEFKKTAKDSRTIEAIPETQNVITSAIRDEKSKQDQNQR